MDSASPGPSPDTPEPPAPAPARRHARIKQLFLAVVDLPDETARAAALAGLAATPEEEAEVHRLLQHSEATTHFSGSLQQATTRWLGTDLQPGDELGAWRLVRPLGQGGMGRVFLAERADGAYQQQVAIKLLRRDLAPDATERFTHERQILAGLNHPHIARLLDGGQTPLGAPYLVMEYVAGERIDRWCQRRQLGLEARLALLATLCEAVAHAHRRLIIHCDLKPSNVLVDEDGRLRLLDFGIAHIEGDHAHGPAGLTPAFASPEQQRGEMPTVATDIYSLGRLMEVLLADLPPQRERELAAIVALATAASPADRYGDVTALAQDLHRLQARQPVQGLRHDRLYGLRLMLRRQWPVWLAGALALLAAAGFTWRLALERDRALAAERQTQQEARTAREVSDFLVNLFSDADDGQHPRASELRALTLLERGQARVARDLADQPAQRAPLLHKLGLVFENMSQTGRAAELHRAAIDAYREVGQHAALPEVYNAYVFSLNRLGRYGEALRALQEWQAQAPPVGPGIAHIDNGWGVVLTNLGRVDEARQHLRRALASQGVAAEAPVPERLSPRARTYLANLALVELAAQRPAEAERLVRLALRPDEVATYRRQGILGLALLAQGQTAPALAALQAGDADAQRRYGDINANRHRVLRDLGWAQLQAGQPHEAVATLRLAMQCAEEGGEAGHPLAAMTQARLAQALAATGARDAARQALDAALAVAQAAGEDGDLRGLAEMRRMRAALDVRAP